MLKAIVRKHLVENFMEDTFKEGYNILLYNNRQVIEKDDLENWLDLIINYIDDNSTTEFISDEILKITTNRETFELKRVEKMTEGEIFVRKYFSDCLDDEIIIKDSLEQIEMNDDNFVKVTDNILDKLSSIENIRMIIDKNDPNYNMNWDALIIKFIGEGKEEIWERI